MADDGALHAAFLAATAGFLQECELETIETNHKERRTASERSKRKAAARRDRYRKKVQNEREVLKRQERALSMQLAELQERELAIKVAELEEAQLRAVEKETQTTTLRWSAWKATAALQKDKRMEAEERHRQLKTAVFRHTNVIHHMKSLLKQMNTPMNSVTPSQQLTTRRDVNAELLFKTFVGELDLLYIQTNDIMWSATSDMVPPAELLMTWNPAKTFLERAAVTVIPFDYKHVLAVVSSAFIDSPSGTRFNGEIEDPENTTATIYHTNYTSDTGECSTLVFYDVVRRYVEADRAVFVWRVLVEGQNDLDGLYADEYAWVVVRPSAEGFGTTLENYARVKPLGLQKANDSTRRLQFVKTLIQSEDESLDLITREMENMLVKDLRVGDLDVVQELNE